MKLAHTSIRRSAGQAVVEFALVAVVLLMMSYPVFDFFRAIQTSLILINVSREGANLAARTTYTTPQQIMDQLAATTPPLSMEDDGMIYITKVMGQKRKTGTIIDNVVVEQYRWHQGWLQSRYVPAASVWNCGASGSHWGTSGTDAGTCLNISSTSRPIASLAISLADGELVYVVDVFYRLPSLFGFGASLTRTGFQFLPDAYSARTIL